jgi:hypothetical protein
LKESGAQGMMSMYFFRFKVANGISLKNTAHTGDDSGRESKGFSEAGFSGSRIGGQDNIADSAGGAVFHTNLLIMLVVVYEF